MQIQGRTLDIANDIRSLSDFKRNSREFLEQMRETGNPVVLTINGKAEVVVQDAASYQKLLDYIDEMEALEGIKRGLANVEAGRVTPLEKFEKDFRKKHAIPRRSR
ncbi:MAG: type II toxin-antitoxin system Phd/YefM family antitoxin [Candidatus Acidiferrales bacterium]|jgi:prevent-host-death family protein